MLPDADLPVASTRTSPSPEPLSPTEAPPWFAEPARAFRPSVFWFWHRIPTASEIREQLADMAAKGVGAFMIQARPALPLADYLSPDFLAAYRRSAEEARRLGLGLTIYDEYGWMSGHGGGHVVAGADSLRERHLFWADAEMGEGRTELQISGIRSPFLDFLGETGRHWIYEGGAPLWGDWQVRLVLSHPEETAGEADIRTLSGPFEISADGPTGCRILVEHDALEHGAARPGLRVTAFLSARCLTSRLVNYRLPATAERFAKTVYGPLLDAAGGAAESLFFDHPYAGFYTWAEHRGALGNSLLDDGAPLAAEDGPALLSLLRDVGPRTAALRAGFLDAYQRRMHEAFFGTLSRWAAERGVGFTGHELLTHVGSWALHGGLSGFDPRTMPGVDYFGIDAYRTETAVDAADYAPQLSARLGDSVARANGRRRCTVEQYATGRETGTASLAGQWGLTAERFRAQSIRHTIFGARRILLHAVNVTDGFDGDDRLLLNPRFDFPPAFNFQPWWEDCPSIFAELARLSAFLEEGEPLRPVALLYPLETIRVEGPASPCGAQFGLWAEALARAGIGYDIVDERGLAARLEVGSDCRTLILPAATHLSAAASRDSIADFAVRGGKLLVSGPMPAGLATDDGASGASSESLRAKDDARLVHLANPSPDMISAAVAALPRPRPAASFGDGRPSWATVARCGEDWRLAVFNDEPRARRLTIDCGWDHPAVEVWDSATGTLATLNPATTDGRFTRTVAAQEVLCLTIRAGEGVARATPGPSADPAFGPTPIAPAPLVLADGWTLEIDGRAPAPIEVGRGWEAQGFSAFSGTGTYRRQLALPPRPDGLSWRLSLPGLRETAELRIDGTFAGRHVAGEASFALPAGPADIALELRVRNTGANRYYAGTPYGPADVPSGLTQAPVLVAVGESGGNDG